MSDGEDTPPAQPESAEPAEPDPPAFEPEIVEGWEYTNFADDDERYQYNGRDSDGEPEYVDFGPKGSN